MKQENINNKVLNDLDNRIDNWDKLEGLPERVDVLETDATALELRVDKNETDILKNTSDLENNTFKIKNEIENGDFSNGFTAYSGATISVVEGNLRVLSNSISGAVTITCNTSIGEKYYLSVVAKTEVVEETNVMFSFLNQGVSAENSSVIPIGLEFRKISAIIIPTKAAFLIGFGRTLDVIYLKKNSYKIINLTQIFGSGNEPTKEEMDLLILQIGYIDGEITLTQKQILNWQLGLIRKNTRAIISLGGTIS